MILTGAKLATDRSKAGERRVADDAQPRVQRTQRFYSVKMLYRSNKGVPIRLS